jgi:spermidine synthase
MEHPFFEQQNISLKISNFETLEQFCSDKQDISLFNHPSLGKILIINGEIQHVENWAPLYHEPLIHLPAAYIPEIKKVLILGGGSLYSAFEVLKYGSVEEVVLLDHDIQVIELMNRHYRHAHQVLKDSRLKIKYVDAYTSIFIFCINRV